MQGLGELPFIINETSQRKYNSYTLYEQQLTHKLSLYTKAISSKNKQNKNCPRKQALTFPITLKKLKSTQARSTMNPSRNSHMNNSMMNLLPPLLSVTAPKGFVLNAYEQLHGFAKTYFRQDIDEAARKEALVLKTLCGSLSSLPKRVCEINKQGSVVLDPLLSIIFYSIQAELLLKEDRMREAVINFEKAQFYSLKGQLFLFAIYCRSEEADLFKSQSDLQNGLKSLKIALGISIMIDNKEIQLSILQKMGMLYYYSGNTALGEQYHRLAEKGLSSKDLEFHKNQFSLSTELAALQNRLFSLQKEISTTKKHINRYEEEINTELQEDSVLEHSCLAQQMVSNMLKNSEEKKVGLRFKGHIRNTLSLAKIIPHTNSPPKEAGLKQGLPFVNVSQVLKSHLSRNRGGSRGNRDWQLRTLLQIIEDIQL